MSTTDDTATAFLEALAGADRVTAIDGECVDSANDYRAAIESVLKATSAGETSLTHFAAIDGTRRKLTIALDGGPDRSFEVEGDTDWIDNAAFVGGLLAALRSIGYARRLVGYWSPAFGQEIGFAMLTDAQIAELIVYGLEKNRSVMLYLDTDDVLHAASEDEGGDPAAWEAAFERFGAKS